MPTYTPKDWEEKTDWEQVIKWLVAVLIPLIVLLITDVMVSLMTAHWAVDDK